MLKIQWVLVGALAWAGLTACAASPTPIRPRPQPTVIASKTVTQAATPTQTTLLATGTPTRQPSPTTRPTATALPATAVAAAATPAPSATVLFPVDLNHDSQATPTALALPGSLAAQYALKDWTEAEALALIDTLEQNARAAGVCFPAGCYRPGLEQAEVPIRWVVQDTISRFPNSSHLEQFQWRLAIANAVLSRSDSNPWLLSTVAAALNQGSVTSTTLSSLLAPHGFEVTLELTATNLYGDGQPAWVFRIKTQNEETSDGLFVAVSRDPAGLFQVRQIESDWAFSFGDDWLADAADHNHNGVDEITFYIGSGSGTLCNGNVLVFEWQHDHFAELTGGQIGLYECSDSWAYNASADGGADSINLDEVVPTAHHDEFDWNGAAYVLHSRTFTRISAYDYPQILDVGSYGDRLVLVQAVIDSLTEQNRKAGPSYYDFLTFQLGYAYALDGQPAAAEATLHSLVISPTNSLTRTLSAAAQSFIQNYHGDADVYSACQAALAVMNQALPSSARGHDDQIMAAWGLDPSYLEDYSYICGLRAAFPLLIGTLNSQSLLADPAAMLQPAGVKIRNATQLDLDGDGTPDWLLLVDNPNKVEGQPGFGQIRVDMWALLNTARGVQTAYFGDAVPFLDGLNTLVAQVQAIAVPGFARPVVLVGLGNALYSYIARGVGAALYFDQLGYPWSFQRYSYSITGQTLEVQLSAAPTGYDQDIRPRYRWEGQAQTWQRVDWPAELIFIQQQPAQAIAPLRAMVAELSSVPADDDDTIARDTFLLASAYEWSGDKPNAAVTYWQLWHSYPASSYARIAQSKLELVQ